MSDYKKILLISEDYIKSNSTLDNNLAGKYLLSAIRSAQDTALFSIIGECLLSSIQQKICDKTIGDVENIAYKYLLDNYIQDFLCMQVLSDVVIPISYKLSNFGVMNSDDEKATVVDNKEINLVKEYYQFKADEYKRRMQEYLRKNKKDFPELEGDCTCETNLYSSNSSGIWLGGPRSKIVPKKCCGRK